MFCRVQLKDSTTLWNPAKRRSTPPSDVQVSSVSAAAKHLILFLQSANQQKKLALAGDLHKTNAARKDAELQGLRRVVAAKEKSIDSLRAQLATCKASLEAYTQEAEAIMQQKDNEVSIYSDMQRLAAPIPHCLQGSVMYTV